MTEAEQIVAMAARALDRAGAPICYLHETGEQGMFAVVVEIEHWRKILGLIPEVAGADPLPFEIGDLVMNHGHIEGDEDR